MENHLSYQGKIGSLYAIWLKNLLLGIITLGIYRAWGKTNYRKYCYNSFVIDNDRPEYTGTGGELFKGFIKFNFLVFIVAIILQITVAIFFDAPKATDGKKAGDAIFSLLFVPVIMYIGYFAKFSSLRYRLSRTRWRGIRGSLRGKVNNYILFRFGRLLINIATLGYCIGRSTIKDQDRLMNQAYFGNTKFEYYAPSNLLDKINLITLLLAIPTLGISRYWFKAEALNVKYNHLTVGGVKFSANFTGRKLALFTVVNFLIWLLTLTIGKPIIIHRVMNYFQQHVKLIGETTSFTQLSQAKSGTFGEGATDYFDTDGIDLDFGLI